MNSPFPVMLLQSHLWTKIYEVPADKCSVSKEMVEIMRRGFELTPEYTSTWLMLYPICWHSCSECFTTERWIDEIETAAIVSIDRYEEVHDNGRLVSMWLAACGVFNAGCILVDIYLRKTSTASRLSSPADKHLKHVLACSDMLFAFAECWDPARTFREVFSKVMDALWERSGVT
jgi:hypothetical protein